MVTANPYYNSKDVNVNDLYAGILSPSVPKASITPYPYYPPSTGTTINSVKTVPITGTPENSAILAIDKAAGSSPNTVYYPASSGQYGYNSITGKYELKVPGQPYDSGTMVPGSSVSLAPTTPSWVSPLFAAFLAGGETPIGEQPLTETDWSVANQGMEGVFGDPRAGDNGNLTGGGKGVTLNSRPAPSQLELLLAQGLKNQRSGTNAPLSTAQLSGKKVYTSDGSGGGSRGALMPTVSINGTPIRAAGGY